MWSMASWELVLPLPAEVVHQGSHQDGPDKASKGEHGHRYGPQQSQEKVTRVHTSSIIVGLIVKLLHDLGHKTKQNSV